MARPETANLGALWRDKSTEQIQHRAMSFLPIATFALSVAVVIIAWRQWRLARSKLRLDLFDRRYKVYEATSKFVDVAPRTRFVIESRQLQRTLLAIFFAVMLSLMLAPHSGRGLLRFMGYAHGPFFITPSYIDGKQLLLQTIFLAVLFAVVVNLFPRRLKK